MNIVCTVTNDLSHDQRMRRICSTLQADGHAVTLVGRTLPNSGPLPEQPFRQYRIACKNQVGKRFYAEYNYRLANTLRTWQLDVVCAVDLDTLLAGYYLTRWTGRALVYDAHEWFSETPEVYRRPAIRNAWRQLGRWLVPRTDARYTVGPMLANRLEEDYGKPFGVVRNAPERSYLPFSENTEGVILYQGMLNPGRGLEAAIGALPSLPFATLWIVGDGPERAVLEALARRLQVIDRVWFAGFRPPVELPALTRQAWLGMNLLEAGSPSYYYSLANKSLDYVQAGLPSCQMDFPEYAALHRQYDCFELIPQLTDGAVAAHVSALWHDPARYGQLRDNCRRAAEILCWERESDEVRRVYRELAARLMT